MGKIASAFISTIIAMTAPVLALGNDQQTVVNDKVGLWDKSGTPTIEVTEELLIGTEQGDENYVFGPIFGVCADLGGSIYVLDRGYRHVRKFDGSGAYLATIGREGDGPGEFRSPSAIAIDNQGLLYVAEGGSRIIVFDANGDYLRDVGHDKKGNMIRSVRVDQLGNIYISSLDLLDQFIVHKYSSAGEYLFSVSPSYAIGTDIDTRIESFYGGGYIDVQDETLYFTQLVPYEIRTFSLGGEAKTTILRENEFVSEPSPPEMSGDRITFRMYAGSFGIVCINDQMFVNVVKIPGNADQEKPAETVLDFFDVDGKLLTTKRFARDLSVGWSDDKNKLYLVEHTNYPVVRRWSLKVQAAAVTSQH